MTDELIAVVDVARKYGMHKQTVFKVMKRLGIKPVKQRSSQHRNQVITYIKHDDLEIILRDGTIGTGNGDQSNNNTSTIGESGVFYLIQLEPEFDPGRFQVGFATNMLERLRTHRCSAPFSEVVETWPCQKLWEKTAIDSVIQECVQLHTEVFRTDNILMIKEKCDKFFSLMPQLGKDSEEKDES